jgi:hypothetical protein
LAAQVDITKFVDGFDLSSHSPERVAGIGPALESWEDPLLPLQHTRMRATPFYADSLVHFDQPNSSAVRRRWQLAHLTSHLATSLRSAAQDALFSIDPMVPTFVDLSL